MRTVTIVGILVAAGASLLGGCQPKGGPSYDIQLTMSENIPETTQVWVEMVGLSDIEYEKRTAEGAFEGESLEAMLGDGGAGADWTFNHPAEGRSKTLSRDHDVWTDWRNDANWVVVLARIGAVTYDALPLPLAEGKWGGREILIEIEPLGLDLQTKQIVN